MKKIENKTRAKLKPWKKRDLSDSSQWILIKKYYQLYIQKLFTATSFGEETTMVLRGQSKREIVH
jgi:hypothetical protein